MADILRTAKYCQACLVSLTARTSPSYTVRTVLLPGDLAVGVELVLEAVARMVAHSSPVTRIVAKSGLCARLGQKQDWSTAHCYLLR